LANDIVRVGRGNEEPLPADPTGRQLSIQKDGSIVWGIPSSAGEAETWWSAGTPPMNGLDQTAPVAQDLRSVKLLDRLPVIRAGERWLVSSPSGEPLGQLRWRPLKPGKRHAVTGDAMAYPERGVLVVLRLILMPGEKDPVDIRGFVEPLRP
jgi:hypothetical protein